MPPTKKWSLFSWFSRSNEDTPSDKSNNVTKKKPFWSRFKFWGSKDETSTSANKTGGSLKRRGKKTVRKYRSRGKKHSK